MKQRVARADGGGLVGPRLGLIPPLSEEFSLYGGDDVTERARQWALANRFVLADGIADCAHGFYAMSMCPSISARCGGFRFMDHCHIWIPDPVRDGSPFLLAHPYDFNEEKLDEARSYAKAHGLTLKVWTQEEQPYNGSNPYFNWNWYHKNTTAIQMSMPPPEDWPVWPIERLVIILQNALPTSWPEEE